MPGQLKYPTPLHEDVVSLIRIFFDAYEVVDSVLQVNSCARGQATKMSDLDIVVLLDSEPAGHFAAQIEQEWQAYAAHQPVIQRFKQMSPFTAVHLDLIDGRYMPPIWDDGGGPDSFELEVGNHIAYSVPIGQAGRKYEALRQKWLPYYGESLKIERAEMVKQAALYDLQFIPFYVKRDLLFQAFDRLYKAEQEFLQLLMISRRRYPLAYNKWIKEQLVQWLGLDEIYKELQTVLTIKQFTGAVLNDNAAHLNKLIDEIDTA